LSYSDKIWHDKTRGGAVCFQGSATPPSPAAPASQILKTPKNAILDLAPPTLQNSGIFHDSIRPYLHVDGLPPKSRRCVVSTCI